MSVFYWLIITNHGFLLRHNDGSERWRRPPMPVFANHIGPPPFAPIFGWAATYLKDCMTPPGNGNKKSRRYNRPTGDIEQPLARSSGPALSDRGSVTVGKKETNWPDGNNRQLNSHFGDRQYYGNC
jgi:hypothetical protein